MSQVSENVLTSQKKNNYNRSVVYVEWEEVHIRTLKRKVLLIMIVMTTREKKSKKIINTGVVEIEKKESILL